MIVTSGAMAVARGQAYDAVGQIVLCTGHGAILVTVDAQGEPIEPPHLCPDCVLAMLADTAVPPVVAPVDLASGPLFAPLAEQANPLSSGGRAKARAPPAVV